MPQLLQIEGVLCGTEVYDYKPFTGEDGREVSGGTVRYVYLATDPETPPDKVKCSDDLYAEMVRAGFLGSVVVLVEPFAKGRRVEYRATKVTNVKPAGRAA